MRGKRQEVIDLGTLKEPSPLTPSPAQVPLSHEAEAFLQQLPNFRKFLGLFRPHTNFTSGSSSISSLLVHSSSEGSHGNPSPKQGYYGHVSTAKKLT